MESQESDSRPKYIVKISGHEIECATPEDGITVYFAERVLRGEETANAAQTLHMASVLSSYGRDDLAFTLTQLHQSGTIGHQGDEADRSDRESSSGG